MATQQVGGAALYYEEHGSGPPVLLIHGTGAFADLWSPILGGLSRRHRVIAYDRRGFARSSGRPGKLADHVRDATALLDTLDASSAAVVGWSGGGVIALGLASSARDRVKTLVLAEPVVHPLTHPTPTSFAMTVNVGFQRFVRRDPRAAAATMYRWAGGYKTGGNAFDKFPAAWREQMLGHAPVALREMVQVTRPYPSRAAIRSIRCPVTIIEGDLSDSAFVKADAFLMRQLPQAQLVRLPDAAHMLHFDQPERWVELIVQAIEAAPADPVRR